VKRVERTLDLSAELNVAGWRVCKIHPARDPRCVGAPFKAHIEARLVDEQPDRAVVDDGGFVGPERQS